MGQRGIEFNELRNPVHDVLSRGRIHGDHFVFLGKNHSQEEDDDTRHDQGASQGGGIKRFDKHLTVVCVNLEFDHDTIIPRSNATFHRHNTVSDHLSSMACTKASFSKPVFFSV